MRHNLSHGKRRDWFYILRKLMKAGVSMGQVARKTGRDKTTVQAWANGSEPKESDARLVLELFAKHCPREYVAHEQQYRIEVDPSALAIDGKTIQGPGHAAEPMAESLK